MTKGQQKQQHQRGPAVADRKGTGEQQKRVRPQVIHGDLYQRANFTLQASAFLQQLQTQPVLPTERPITKESADSSDDDSSKRRDAPDLTRLSRNIMAANGKMVIHNQMKLDPSMKRNICRACSTVLIPGLTSRIRNRPSRAHFNVTHTSCLSCDTRRTVPCPPTSIGEAGLDGKKRAARRSKQAQQAKVPFYNREVTTESASLPAAKGHTLWRGDSTVDNWGEIPTATGMATCQSEQ